MKTIKLSLLAIGSILFLTSCSSDVSSHHYWGMHWLWWIVWIIFIIWIFATPWNVPGQRNKRDSPLDILRKRYAAGEINKEEYEEMKRTLE